MKINIFIYLAITMIVMSLSSCEDFLTQENPNNVPFENYWQDLNDCDKGLTAVYNQFRYNQIWSVDDNAARTDLIYVHDKKEIDDEYYNQTYNFSSGAPQNQWSALYMGIFRANQVIKGLAGLDTTTYAEREIATWKKINAQARFFRGLFHFYLHNSFNNGKVIIYDFVPVNAEDTNQPLSSSEEVQAFFRNDLEYAAENLPSAWAEYNGLYPVPSKDVGRVTKWAAKAVLGKSYLYEKDYAKAEVIFKEIIDSGQFELAEVSDNMTTKGEFSKESILEVSYTDDHKTQENNSSALGTSSRLASVFSNVGGYATQRPALWLTMAYKKDPIDSLDSRNFTVENIRVDPTLGLIGDTTWVQYSWRTLYNIALVDDQTIPYYGYQAAQVGKYKYEYYALFRKHTNYDIVSNEDDILDKSPVNYRVIRYADILLMYAESLIQGGTDNSRLPEAVGAINQVRYRSGVRQLELMADTAGFVSRSFVGMPETAKDVMNHLMYVERPLELNIEGFNIRQIDMRRWGIAKKRFVDLSSKTYWCYTYKYPRVDDPTRTSNAYGSFLVDEEPNAEEINGSIQTDVEFSGAAVNYNAGLHDYWPIPVNETSANPYID